MFNTFAALWFRQVIGIIVQLVLIIASNLNFLIQIILQLISTNSKTFWVFCCWILAPYLDSQPTRSSPMGPWQRSQSRTGGCTGLTSGTIYFGIGQYQCTVSGLPLFYIYMCVCVCIIINITVYYKTLPQFRTNYSWF